MLDLVVAYNRYRFLGDEFLTWLWYTIENDPSVFKSADPDCQSLEVGNRIVFENRKTKSVERITIKGDEAGLEEGRLAFARELWFQKSLWFLKPANIIGSSASRVKVLM